MKCLFTANVYAYCIGLDSLAETDFNLILLQVDKRAQNDETFRFHFRFSMPFDGGTLHRLTLCVKITTNLKQVDN